MQSSTSLWGRELKYCTSKVDAGFPKSTSLWGRELKWQNIKTYVISQEVDLLVRSWIEINSNRYFLVLLLSTSLWGRELKYPDIKLRQIHLVDLLVRSWIEIYTASSKKGDTFCRPPCEVVNWNATHHRLTTNMLCRPPCEVVNWNKHN